MGKLWTPGDSISIFGPRQYLQRKFVKTLPNGKRVQVTIEDGGRVTHIEHDHHLDAVVRPKVIAYRFPKKEN